MTSYRYELEFDRHAAPLRHTPPELRFFPLQAFLVDVTKGQQKPAWITKLSPGDTLTIRLLDISDLIFGTATDDGDAETPVPKSFAMHCTAPRNRSRRIDVFAPEITDWQRIPYRGPSTVFTTSRQEFVGVDFVPPHGMLLTVRPFKETADMFVELGFHVIFEDGLLERNYVHDPEMIVSGSGSGDQSGVPAP